MHTLSAEWGWLDRCGGLRRGPALKGEDYPTMASLASRWREISFGTGPTHAMRVEHLLRHSANHATHHRGQVAMMLRMMDVVPGNFDLLWYPGRTE